MIAQPNSHYDNDILLRLLEDRLSGDQAERVEVHLSQCDVCRAELEQIAGQSHWWDETISVLSDTTATPRQSEDEKSHGDPPSAIAKIDATVSAARADLDASLDWIRPLLDQTDDASFIGRIDQYPVQGVIGQGGMGVVLRGIDPELSRPVAIKVLSPHLAGVGAARARFMREAQAAAAIVHPSIVPIYSVAKSARLPYIVMPCIHGGNLQERIGREGPLEISEVLRIGLQIAEGLAAAHKQGVIHRDIKPANILIEEGNGRVLISDFGLARALDDASLTISGMIAGTPQYMSPEQARGEAIDARSDLYSLGSLLYALATGRPPFRAESPLAVLRKISEARPRPVHQINERIPPWFDTLVQQLMRIEADKRIPDAESATQILRETHAHVQNPAANSLPKSLMRRRLPSNVLAATAVAVAVMIVVAGAGYAWSLSHQISTAGANSKSDAGFAENNAESGQASVHKPPQTELQLLTWQGGILDSELMLIQQKLGELESEMESNSQLVPTAPTHGVIETRRED